MTARSCKYTHIELYITNKHKNNKNNNNYHAHSTQTHTHEKLLHYEKMTPFIVLYILKDTPNKYNNVRINK